MKIITFFNNKGGVGKTSLVYHLAWMLKDMGYQVVAADLDPQSNLSGMFLAEDKIGKIWKAKKSLNAAVDMVFRGVGDIDDNPYTENIDGINLLVGDLNLAKREDELSDTWTKCLNGDERAFRVTTSFSRLIAQVGERLKADYLLIDVGPSLGAINRAALIASDYVIIPLAPDLFSLQGLINVGSVLASWSRDWQKRIKEKPKSFEAILPTGKMSPLGYLVMRHSVISSRPVRAYQRWIDKIPEEYVRSVIKPLQHVEDTSYLLANLKDYRSLMPLAQEARKPMFSLKPADGAIGAQQRAVSDCYDDFHELAQTIIGKIKQADGVA